MRIEGSQQQRRLVLRGAQVISIAEDRADCEAIDVLFENDRMAGMGSELDAAGADIHDLSGRIVLPGLINAHLHTWQTATRRIGADWTMLG